MKKSLLLATILTLFASSFAQSEKMHHYNNIHDLTQKPNKQFKLTEDGNDIFGTIAETVKVLNANLNTDWSSVNLEALRQHLLDMRDMSENIAIHKQIPIKNGVKISLSPITKRAKEALKRVFLGHPKQLNRETGWVMDVNLSGNTYMLTITGKPQDALKIQGLGYIGLMTNGSHHQPHHLSIASGNNPHKH